MSALRRWWQRGRAQAQRFGFSQPDRREVGLRLRIVLGLAAVVGVSTGCIVAAFDKVVRDGMFAWVLRQPVALAAAIPAVGLTVAVLVARLPGHADTATTDAYVRTYHERGGTMRVRDLWAKLLECAATLGSGGALGYEGPALLSGATVGSWAESRFMQRFRQDDAKVLMVAGAAAGIAAVFRAPLTGIVFALEVPYTQDLARRALLPALVAASTSYVTFVALLGTGRIFEISGGAAFDLRDLLGGFVVGLLCGTLARVGAWAIAHAKHLAIPVAVRVAGAGLALFVLALVSHEWFDAPAQPRIRLRGNRLGATPRDRARPARRTLLGAVRRDVVHRGRRRCRRTLHPPRHPRRDRGADRPSHRPRTQPWAVPHRRHRRVPRRRLPHSPRRRLLRRRSHRPTRIRRSRPPRRRRLPTRHGPLVLQSPPTRRTTPQPHPPRPTHRRDPHVTQSRHRHRRSPPRRVPHRDVTREPPLGPSPRRRPLLRAPRPHRHREDPTRTMVPAHRTRRRSHRRPHRPRFRLRRSTSRT